MSSGHTKGSVAEAWALFIVTHSSSVFLEYVLLYKTPVNLHEEPILFFDGQNVMACLSPNRCSLNKEQLTTFSYSCREDARLSNWATCYLAVSRWNGLGLVSAHIIIYAFLKLLGYQSTIFPTTLRVWQTLPLAQVVWVTSFRPLVWMPCTKKLMYQFTYTNSIKTSLLL